MVMLNFISPLGTLLVGHCVLEQGGSGFFVEPDVCGHLKKT